MQLKLLDCSLRDGGYYNDWDFTDEFVRNYLHSLNYLPVDYIEIGYLSPNLSGYKGKYYYLNSNQLDWIKSQTTKKLALMIDVKNIIDQEDFVITNAEVLDKVDLVRLATDYKDFEKSVKLSKLLKSNGLDVAVNLMKFGEIILNVEFKEKVKLIEPYIEYLYIVDSYGSLYPNDIVKIIKTIKEVSPLKIGFHGHNNLELAFSNTLSAIDNDVSIVDATFTGMGRGAGNLKMELLIMYVKSKLNQKIKVNELQKIVHQFQTLKNEYNWGTSLPYMISGLYSLPQNEVMDLVSLNRYSFESIINNLVSENKIICKKFKLNKSFPNALLIGGGKSVKTHLQRILNYINKNSDLLLIFCTSKYINYFNEVDCYKIFAVSGDETLKYKGDLKMNNFVLSPSPRVIDPYENDRVEYEELDSISFIENSSDSPLSIALQITLELKIDKINLVGFDGFKNFYNYKDSLVFKETQEVITKFSNHKKLNSLTPSLYKDIIQKSIYHN